MKQSTMKTYDPTNPFWRPQYPHEIEERKAFIEYAQKKYGLQVVAVVNEGRASKKKLTAWFQVRNFGIVSGYPDCLLDLIVMRPENHRQVIYVPPQHQLMPDTYFGLRIEMKRLRGYYGIRENTREAGWLKAVEENQRTQIDLLRERGFAAVVAFGADEANLILDTYLAGSLYLPKGYFYPANPTTGLIDPTKA